MKVVEYIFYPYLWIIKVSKFIIKWIKSRIWKFCPFITENTFDLPIKESWKNDKCIMTKRTVRYIGVTPIYSKDLIYKDTYNPSVYSEKAIRLWIIP